MLRVVTAKPLGELAATTGFASHGVLALCPVQRSRSSHPLPLTYAPCQGNLLNA